MKYTWPSSMEESPYSPPIRDGQCLSPFRDSIAERLRAQSSNAQSSTAAEFKDITDSLSQGSEEITVFLDQRFEAEEEDATSEFSDYVCIDGDSDGLWEEIDLTDSVDEPSRAAQLGNLILRLPELANRNTIDQAMSFVSLVMVYLMVGATQLGNNHPDEDEAEDVNGEINQLD
jgi:hypothetical protein